MRRPLLTFGEAMGVIFVALTIVLLFLPGCDYKPRQPRVWEFPVSDKRPTLDGRCVFKIRTQKNDYIDLISAKGQGCDAIPGCIGIYGGEKGVSLWDLTPPVLVKCSGPK